MIKKMKNQDIIILKDKNKNGKENNWSGKKMNNLQLSESYKRLGNINKFLRTKDCSTYLEFKVNDIGDMKLHHANFCRVRLCPLCSWRRTLKIFGQTSKVMDYYSSQNPTDKYIFITLTLENCKADELSKTIDIMFEGFRRMFQYKQVKEVVKGYFRALEVTYNKKEDTFHPHFHIVASVGEEYLINRTFNGKGNKYLKQSDWTQLWKKALKIDYIPVVNVKVVKNRVSGVKEISKYSVKDTDYLTKSENQTDYLVSVLDKSLHKRRLFSFGAEFNVIHKKLNLDDVTDGDLINTDNEGIRQDLRYIILKYSWNIGFKNYILKI